MDEAMKDRLTRSEIWMRGLYMLLFVLVYSLAELVIAALVVVQFVIVLFTGRGNENLVRLGNNLSMYVYQIFRFQTFNSEDRPYPFGPWPDEPVGDNPWLNARVTVEGVSGVASDASSAETGDAGPSAAGDAEPGEADNRDPRTLP